MRKIRRILYKIKIKISRMKKIFLFYLLKCFYRNLIYFVYTPEHGNIGDHAIAKATQELFLKTDIKYKEITFNELERLNNAKRLKLLNKRTIVINGGGNLGTLWFNCEKLTRAIIQNNSKSKIIIMPNTIYYEDSEWGKQELENSIKIYNSHENLFIYAREKISYEYMKNIYNNVFLCPDMVLSLDEIKDIKRENRCTLFLRKDCEKTIDEGYIDKIAKTVKKLFSNVVYSDTVIDKIIHKEGRDTEVEKKLDEFRTSKLVVTDRLHGMIFSAITGTPCIVLKSKSPKVVGCYEWIKHLDYIKFCDNIDDIENLIKSMPQDYKIYDNTMYEKNYIELIKNIKGNNGKD